MTGMPGAIGLGVERSAVDGVRAHGDAPIAVVLDSGGGGFAGLGDGDPETAREGRAGAGGFVGGDIHDGVAARHHGPVF